LESFELPFPETFAPTVAAYRFTAKDRPASWSEALDVRWHTYSRLQTHQLRQASICEYAQLLQGEVISQLQQYSCEHDTIPDTQVRG